MNKIESTVADILYEKEPSFPYQYTNEVISDCELLVGKLFPDDFKWYLLNVGWRRIAYDHRSILIPNEEYIYHLQFEGAEHQTFSINRYKQYLEGNELLPYDKRLYFPFGRATGEINPAVSYQLLISLNDENDGSVWAIISQGAHENPAPLKIADKFTLFLAQISAADKLEPIAAKNNQALFLRLMKHYVPGTLPTTAATADQLIHLYFAQQFIVNGTRNVEFQYLSNGVRVENERQFAMRAGAFEKMSHPGVALQRREIRISNPEVYYFRWDDHNYYLLTVDSIVGDKNILKEQFVLYHDVLNLQWSMVRRYQATIDDVKIKGVGTFTFDDTYKWMLKKKATPAWSELPAGLHITGEEDAMSGPLITFVKEVLSKADFKPVLEAFIFKDYEAGGDMRLTSPQEVWQLLGKNCNIYIDSNNEFRFHIDCSWDQEHGLTIRVKDWQIS